MYQMRLSLVFVAFTVFELLKKFELEMKMILHPQAKYGLTK